MWAYVISLSPTPSFDDGITPWSWDSVTGHWVLGTYSVGAFSFDPYADTWSYLPSEMPEGSSFTVDVIFTPTTLGEQSAYLQIQSNDSIPPPGPQALILLEGTGVEASVPESSTMLLLGSGLFGIVGMRRRIKK